MPNCLTPLTVRLSDKAYMRRNLSWTIHGSDPFRKPTIFVNVRCGKCANCLKQKRREWVFRLHNQMLSQNFPSYFVTLTYDPENIPVDGVIKKDVQDYVKRLRHNQEEHFSYFCVSEYGAKNGRAHYHMLFFNVRFDSFDFSKAWPHGFVFVGNVTPQSINYCAKYFVTKQQHPDNQNPNFCLMSKGIGLDFCNDKIRQYLIDGNPLKFEDSAISLPRYYKEKLNIDSFDLPYHKLIDIDKFNDAAEWKVYRYNMRNDRMKHNLTYKKCSNLNDL